MVQPEWFKEEQSSLGGLSIESIVTKETLRDRVPQSSSESSFLPSLNGKVHKGHFGNAKGPSEGQILSPTAGYAGITLK